MSRSSSDMISDTSSSYTLFYFSVSEPCHQDARDSSHSQGTSPNLEEYDTPTIPSPPILGYTSQVITTIAWRGGSSESPTGLWTPDSTWSSFPYLHTTKGDSNLHTVRRARSIPAGSPLEMQPVRISDPEPNAQFRRGYLSEKVWTVGSLYLGI